MPRVVAIANPMAQGGKVGRRLPHFEQELGTLFPGHTVEIRRTADAGEAVALATAAVAAGADYIAAIGGDGTMNEVANGFMDAGEAAEKSAFVPVPAGTGGDFVRSLGLASGKGLARMFDGASIRPIDVGRVTVGPLHEPPTSSASVRHFLNISSFGSSGLAVDRVNKTSKALGGRLSFMVGTVRGMIAYRNRRVRLRIDEHFEEDMLINTVAVANGRFFGGGMMVAPDALLDDGQFDVVILGDIGVGTYLRHGGKLYRGEHLQLPEMRCMRGKRVTATLLNERGGPVCIEADGEQPGNLPATFSIQPKALRVFAPWHRACAV